MKRAKVNLPPSCSRCRANDGAWSVDHRTGGVERCDCPRGQMLAELAKPKRRRRKTA